MISFRCPPSPPPFPVFKKPSIILPAVASAVCEYEINGIGGLWSHLQEFGVRLGACGRLILITAVFRLIVCMSKGKEKK